MTPYELARILRKQRLVTDITEFACEAAVVEPVAGVSWADIALFCSTIEGGTFRPLDYGIFNKNGAWNHWLMTAAQAEKVRIAQKVALEITGEGGGYSVASNAKHCLKWAVPPLKEKCELAPIMEKRKFGHHHCRPGRYADGELLDIVSCYWQVLGRLPSLKYVWLNETEFIKHSHTKDETLKLGIVMERLEVEPDMRRSAWGAALGSTVGGTVYSHGLAMASSPYWGPYPTAALLTARIAYDLTQEGSRETNATMSQTDGIIVKAGRVPRYWKKHGIKSTVKYAGNCHIQGQHRYRIGNHCTEWYSPHEKCVSPLALGPRPDILYPDIWLQ